MLDKEFGVEPVDPLYRGEVAKRWQYKDGCGEIGVIASVTQPFCGDCTRSRLSAEGKLYTCLFAVRGHDLRALIRGGATRRGARREAARDLARPRRPLLRAPRPEHRRPCDRRAQGRDVVHRRLAPRKPGRMGGEPTFGLPVPRVRPGHRIECRDVGRCSRAAVLAARMVGSRSPDRDLARVPARVPGRARAGRPRPEEAFSNGLKVVDFETDFSDRLYELTLQQFVEQRDWLASLATWTYWNSEFTVLDARAALALRPAAPDSSRASATRCCSRT